VVSNLADFPLHVDVVFRRYYFVKVKLSLGRHCSVLLKKEKLDL
jgi:hypothetical protein